uniref:C2H2-type domain-containing protein n=1 Tax=Caenorhabditis japonica TaxID=281687 RepID=A0A8R1EKW2_CAEJA
MRLSEDSDMCTTCNCHVDFADRPALIEHYQSQYHRYNTLRKAKNLPVFTEEDFEGIEHSENDLSTNQSVIGLESDDEEFDALLLPANRAFFTKNDCVFSIPRNILHCDEKDVTSSTFLRPFDCAIFLWNGGHFAAAIFENDKMSFQKSFHRYVARAKQGGVQSQHDSGGKGAAKSAGAKLRRYNEQKMKEEIESTMSSWKPRLQETPLLFIRCAAYHRNIFFEANAGIEQRDARIRTIPFETKRPNIEEITDCWQRLQSVQSHGTDTEFRAEMNEVREKRKRLARKVAGKKRKGDGMQLICEWSDDEDVENAQKPKRTHHIKVRTIRTEEAPIQWPSLDDEWRQKRESIRIEGSWLMGTIFNHAFGSTKLNRPQEELNQGVQIAVCNSLATTPKESAIRKKKDRESRRLRRADSTEKEKMMERISNSQSKLETRLSETQERADERRASLQSNAKAKRASETKEQRTERFTYHSTRYRNKKDEKNATTAKDAFGGGR